MRRLCGTGVVALGIVALGHGCNGVGTPVPETPDSAVFDASSDAAPTDSDAPLTDAAAPSAESGSDATSPAPALPAACRGAKPSTAAPGPAPVIAAGLTVPTGFAIERIATVPSARELAPLPNGDLLVGTNDTSVYIVPNAEAEGAAGMPSVFATIDDAPVHGVTFDGPSCTIFVGTQRGVYAIPYEDGQTKAASVTKIASVRGGPSQSGGDNGHKTTSVAVAGKKLYVAVGSSCNACVETDATRAAISEMNPDGSSVTTKAKRFRNAIALTTNPDTGTLWAGGAEQDALPQGHPYEPIDAVTLHEGVADYGWPECAENQHAYVNGASCAGTVTPRVVLPAYSTPIGAVFYPATQAGAHAFPAAQRGFFVTAHGAWHKQGDVFSAPPRVVLVPMNGDSPKTAVDWSDPTKQWTEFVSGFEPGGTKRIGRPSGIAVGSAGSLFVGDDHIGVVYRVRAQ